MWMFLPCECLSHQNLTEPAITTFTSSSLYNLLVSGTAALSFVFFVFFFKLQCTFSGNIMSMKIANRGKRGVKNLYTTSHVQTHIYIKMQAGIHIRIYTPIHIHKYTVEGKNKQIRK